MTRTLRFILGDQLSRSIASLRDAEPDRDDILMVEVGAEATYVPHHPKKIAFLFSAMRHFAAELSQQGFSVDYVRLDDAGNSQDFRSELVRACERHKPDRVVVTEPGEWRVWEDMQGWAEACGVPVEIREDDRFLCSRAHFARWAEGRKQLRMEFFYRDMRRRTGLLMDGDKPVGGQWNYDQENRKSIPKGTAAPPAFAVQPDQTTQDVLALVGGRFGDHFGDLEPFDFAVTAADAEAAFEDFLAHRLASFGDYQDAMKQDSPTLWHAVISPYLNTGLLDPLTCCKRAETEYLAGRAPLNAVEGFIRQILGWREYVRGIYWLKMPDYAETNFLDADRQLPAFYWSGDTDMNCLAQAIGQTKRLAY
ncbi:MAG: cryptochrome/photolyase family protein, partial [Alphaproteobacteria bacterium]|nr:cryptochrome/photolyase family protein [Alphaproteobacteria bacterium]